MKITLKKMIITAIAVVAVSATATGCAEQKEPEVTPTATPESSSSVGEVSPEIEGTTSSSINIKIVTEEGGEIVLPAIAEITKDMMGSVPGGENENLPLLLELNVGENNAVAQLPVGPYRLSFFSEPIEADGSTYILDNYSVKFTVDEPVELNPSADPANAVAPLGEEVAVYVDENGNVNIEVPMKRVAIADMTQEQIDFVIETLERADTQAELVEELKSK